MKYSNEYMYGGKKKKKKKSSYKKGGKLTKAEDRIKQLEAEINFMKRGGRMPYANSYQTGGEIVDAVGSGLYGLGEGALNTLTFGLTKDITGKGYEAIRAKAGLADVEYDEYGNVIGSDAGAGIRGMANAAGAVGGAVVTGGVNTGAAISEGAGGIGDALGATGNEDLEKVGTGVEIAGQIAGAVVGDPTAAAGGVTEGVEGATDIATTLSDTVTTGTDVVNTTSDGSKVIAGLGKFGQGQFSDNSVKNKMINEAVGQGMGMATNQLGNISAEEEEKNYLAQQEALRQRNLYTGSIGKNGGNIYNNYAYGNKMYNRYANMHQTDPNMMTRDDVGGVSPLTDITTLGGGPAYPISAKFREQYNSQVDKMFGKGDNEKPYLPDNAYLTRNMFEAYLENPTSKTAFMNQYEAPYVEESFDDISSLNRENSRNSVNVENSDRSNIKKQMPPLTKKSVSSKPKDSNIREGLIPIYGNQSFENPKGELIGYRDIYTGGFKNIDQFNYGGNMYNDYAYGNKMYNDYAKGGKADFETHMMFDPKTGKGYKANEPADHERMKKLGYLHKNEMAYGSKMYNEYESGGKLPESVLRSRVESHMSKEEADNYVNNYKAGGKQMIKRADGSYSQRGLWDNIRANKGSGKKPTKEMLAQEKKINKKAYGGNMLNNNGFGNNNMNQISVNEFGAGGTHEENPLGGIPQGMGLNGAPNLVEQGELKIPDPRDPNASFIVSAQKDMIITKELAKEHNLPKKYVGKTVRKAADMLLRKNDVFTREGDSITENSIDLVPFMEAHEALTAIKEAKEEESFNKEMTAIAEKYPQQMQGAMPQEPMHQMPDGSMMPGAEHGGSEEMSEEEMMMMMQQEASQGMPMAKHGGKIHNPYKQFGGNIHQTNPNMSTDPMLVNRLIDAENLTRGENQFQLKRAVDVNENAMPISQIQSQKEAGTFNKDLTNAMTEGPLTNEQLSKNIASAPNQFDQPDYQKQTYTTVGGESFPYNKLSVGEKKVVDYLNGFNATQDQYGNLVYNSEKGIDSNQRTTDQSSGLMTPNYDNRNPFNSGRGYMGSERNTVTDYAGNTNRLSGSNNAYMKVPGTGGAPFIANINSSVLNNAGSGSVTGRDISNVDYPSDGNTLGGYTITPEDPNYGGINKQYYREQGLTTPKKAYQTLTQTTRKNQEQSRRDLAKENPDLTTAEVNKLAAEQYNNSIVNPNRTTNEFAMGGNIHQYNPKMFNMLNTSLNPPAVYSDFEDTPEGQYMQQSLNVPNTFDSSIPEYLQYDSSQGPMFEPTFLSDITYNSPGQVPRQGIPFTDEFYNSSAPFNVDGPINIPGQNPGMAQEYNSDPNAFITAMANPSNQADLSNVKLDPKTEKIVNIAKKNQDEEVKTQTKKVVDTQKELKKDPDNVKKIEKLEYEQSRLSALTQTAPIAYNLGMGLFGKKDEITLSKLDPITLQRIDAEQQLKGLGYDLAGAKKAFRNAAGGSGSYLANMGSLFNRGSEARARIYDGVNRANTGIDNREAQMNLNVAARNAAASDKETLYSKQAEQARQNMFNAGLGQLGQYASMQDKNKLGAMYANAYADNPLFKLDYNTAFSKEAREKRKKARKK